MQMGVVDADRARAGHPMLVGSGCSSLVVMIQLAAAAAAATAVGADVGVAMILLVL